MVRISGVNIPGEKRVDRGLTYVYGIGNTSAIDILKRANVSPSIRANNLTDEEITLIRAIIDVDYPTEGNLRRVVSQNIKRLIEIRSIKGRRHRSGLPVRGQRTKTNARTRKGKVKLPITNKK
jgi:small subunit ribosomal protein S13